MWRLTSLVLGLWFVTPLFAEELPLASPEDVGLSSEVLDRIDPAMQAYIDEGKLSGITTMVARNGKIAHFKSFGLRDIAAKKPMQPDTIVRIYSMTKPVTSVALMQLYEQGKFQLDDPVAKYLPAFEGIQVTSDPSDENAPLLDTERPMTIRDLLRHTSGLTYGLFGNSVIDRKYRELNLLNRDAPLDEFIEKLTTVPLLFQPGGQWNYSVSVDVQGRLVEVLSGEPLDTYFAEHIFEPLDMKDTAFFVPAEKLDRFATNYGTVDGSLSVIDAPESSNYRYSPKFFSGGGGLVSTARDYMRFCQMLLNGGQLDDAQILKPETVALMSSNHLPEEIMPIGFGFIRRSGVGFGLGFAVRVEATSGEPPEAVGEYSWGGAASTNFWIVPELDLIGIALTQHMPLANAYDRDFRRIVYEAAGAPLSED